mgnify:CR=1 FL=1
MDTQPIKNNPRSKKLVEGNARASNRSMYDAMGYQESDFKRPMVGVANGHSTITPCNSGLQKLADAAVEGIEEAFGEPLRLRRRARAAGDGDGTQGCRGAGQDERLLDDLGDSLVDGGHVIWWSGLPP